ncbi:MAG TPA: hypothetical protein ENJ09_12590 [Planctomycetes bacterium]|nr:hypothetical protein [Planctomycetota bacterium]
MILSVLLTFLAAPAQEPAARHEVVPDFRVFAGPARTTEDFEGVRLERITTAVPWPRGLVVVGDRLIVLARGRHRNAGGIDPSIDDACGTLFEVDPEIFEPVLRGEAAGDEVRRNARVFAEPEDGPFRLFHASMGEPAEATTIDRPYCTLAHDSVSGNFFLCGYSGVDLPGKRFRKNASDSILRFDPRDGRWHVVERHDPGVVPEGELGYVVSNDYYPHHDPERHPAPHGWLNGPDGGLVVGDYFYAAGKDNHTVARYDLTEIRRDPSAPAPASEKVLGRAVDLRLGGRIRRVEALGASALEARDGYLYVGYRTSSIVVRFPIEEETGKLVEPVVGELVAVFEPWDPESGRSANLIDIAFSSKGELFVSCASNGRVWNIGIPDPENVFDGVDVGDNPTRNRPFLDLPSMTANPRARCGNITFDEEDRVYLCSGNYDSGTRLAGVIYRAVRD